MSAKIPLERVFATTGQMICPDEWLGANRSTEVDIEDGCDFVKSSLELCEILLSDAEGSLLLFWGDFETLLFTLEFFISSTEKERLPDGLVV